MFILPHQKESKIETYLELSFPVQKIVGRLGRQPSTISRELRHPLTTMLSMPTSVTWSEKRSVVYRRSLRLKKESASSKSYRRRGPLNRLLDACSKKKDSR